MRRLLNVLLCFIIIFSICLSVSVPGTAVFVVDDALIASIVVSMCASVILSVGIAYITDSESVYVEGVKAMAEIVADDFIQQMNYATFLANFVVVNGKAYLRADNTLFSSLRDFILNYDFSSLSIHHNITVNNSDFHTSATTDNYSNIESYVAVGSPGSTLSVSNMGYTVSYLPGSGQLSFYLNDGTFFARDNVFAPEGTLSIVLYPILSNGSSTLRRGYTRNYAPAEPGNIYYVQGSLGDVGFTRCDRAYYNGQSVTFWYNERDIYCNNERIYYGMYGNNWARACCVAGRILCNRTNTIYDVNTTDGTSIEVPLGADVVREAPAIPGNKIGKDQTALIPVPGNFVDPSSGMPLTQRTVKNRMKRGQDVAFVPDVGQLQDKTPADLGVQIVNNVDVEDTVVSPTLSTTYIGENSTTYAIIPQVPINTPIPEDLDSPVYSSPYPDVINPGNEQITVTANNDVFPTAGETPSERPSVQVTDNAEIASSAVEDISEIASEAVSDIVQPVGPQDIERSSNRMKISSQLLHKFPFCIPYDFYNAIAQFSAPGEVIKFDIPFHIESLNYDYTFHIDLTEWEKVAQISRWFFSVSWVVVLIMLTRKVIWK